MRRYAVLATIATLLLLQSAVVRAADCSTICKEVDETSKNLDVNHTIIDANKGDVSRQRFDETTDRVQVVFVNKNPFKYSYKFSIVSKPLDQGIITDGLKLLGITVPDSGVLAGLPPPGTTACPGVTPKPFDDAVDDVKAKEEALRNIAVPLKDASKKYDEFVDLTKDDKVECVKVCQPAKDLLIDLKKLRADLKPARDALAALKAAIEAARSERTKLEKEIEAKVTDPTTKTTCLDNVEATFNLVDELAGKLKDYEDSFTEIEKNQKRFEQLQTIIEKLSATSFIETADAFSAGGPTDVTITINRTEFSTGTDKPAIVRHLQFGESPFSISAGLGWTTIEAPRLIRQRAPKEGSTTEIVEVFGEENNSSIQPLLIGQLNARLGPKFTVFRAWPAAFGVSVGAVLADTIDTMDSAYHAGISLILANNSFVLTLAYHSAMVSHLASGFKIGDPIPASIQDPLPQEKDREGGVMIGITYRTR